MRIFYENKYFINLEIFRNKFPEFLKTSDHNINVRFIFTNLSLFYKFFSEVPKLNLYFCWSETFKISGNLFLKKPDLIKY